MTTFAITGQNEVIEAVNYAISNLGSQTGILAGNALTVNPATNAVTVGVGGEVYAYNVQFINIRYANNATGTSGFSTAPTNSYFYGIQATANSVPSTVDNPASYNWNQVAGNGFSTTNFLFYLAPGGRQVTFAVSPSAPNSGFQQTVDGNAIDLDLITTIAANAVTSNTIANGTITGSQIAANTITGFNIQTGTITGSDIASSTITGTNITNFTITATKIANATITNQQIANATITGTNIANTTITNTNIANATISGAKIATNTVTGTNIGLQTITANNIANNTITSQQLATTISVTGNITASYFIGNGSQLTGIDGNSIIGGYGNANVAAYLPTFTGNLTAGNISVTGNVTAGYFLGNGSQLTGTYSDSNVVTLLTAFGSNTISTTGSITSSNFITPPVALANLTAVSGSRAFVNNANLVAANNFGQQISGGGSNIVPVWSNGTDWFIG
jgi:hypothetical protein